MENNTNTKGGFWMLVEDLNEAILYESNNAAAAEKKEILDDEFFPDTSF
jgi:hypothetical protein